MQVSRFLRALAALCLCLAWRESLAADTDCRSDALFELSLDDNLLSLNSKNVCLGTILQELERQARVTVHAPASLPQKGVSESFRELPLEQGMERILKGTNYLLWTKAPKAAPAAQPAGAPGTVEIWIVPREPSSETAAIGQTDVPADPLERAKRYLEADAYELVEQARSAPDPKLRADAVALLVHAEKDAEVSETIVSALHDPDPRVRKAALHIVGDLGPEAPGALEAITKIARADESPQLRMRALRKLFEEDYPPDVAKNSVIGALQDPHEDVRNLARSLLELVIPQDRAD